MSSPIPTNTPQSSLSFNQNIPPATQEHSKKMSSEEAKSFLKKLYEPLNHHNISDQNNSQNSSPVRKEQSPSPIKSILKRTSSTPQLDNPTPTDLSNIKKVSFMSLANTSHN